MKNVILLLLVVGIPVAAWLNKDKLMALVKPSAPAGEVTEDGVVVPADSATPADRSATVEAGVPTPHPAKEAQLAATKAYPALNIPNSPFNKRFLALHAEAKHSDPQLLARPDWPLKLAERTAVALGGAPMPIPSTPEPGKPSGLQGSALDFKPKKKH